VPSPRLDAVAEEPHEPHELDEPHHDVGELLWDEVVSFVLIYVLFLVLGFVGTCGY
jgi:phosphatidylglycerophosphatase A